MYGTKIKNFSEHALQNVQVVDREPLFLNT